MRRAILTCDEGKEKRAKIGPSKAENARTRHIGRLGENGSENLRPMLLYQFFKPQRLLFNIPGLFKHIKEPLSCAFTHLLA